MLCYAGLLQDTLAICSPEPFHYCGIVSTKGKGVNLGKNIKTFLQALYIKLSSVIGGYCMLLKYK